MSGGGVVTPQLGHNYSRLLLQPLLPYVSIILDTENEGGDHHTGAGYE